MAYGQSDPNQLVLTVCENMVPHESCRLDLQRLREKSRNPAEQKLIARDKLSRLGQAFIHAGTGLFEQAPKNLEVSFDEHQVHRVEAVQSLLHHKVRKDFERV